ncbi:hypothetical protein D9M70_549930 [compost metagenome]
MPAVVDAESVLIFQLLGEQGEHVGLAAAAALNIEEAGGSPELVGSVAGELLSAHRATEELGHVLFREIDLLEYVVDLLEDGQLHSSVELLHPMLDVVGDGLRERAAPIVLNRVGDGRHKVDTLAHAGTPPTILSSKPSVCCSSFRMSARISASVRSGAGL